MKDWTYARTSTVVRELDDLDECIKAKLILFSTYRNEEIEKGDEIMPDHYMKRIAEFERIRGAIDTIIEFLDSREVTF